MRRPALRCLLWWSGLDCGNLPFLLLPLLYVYTRVFLTYRPTGRALERLELSDNLISEGRECLQDSSLVLLRSLSLANNKIATLDALEPLGSLPNLRDLDLFNCAVTETDNYRTEVFNMLPVLKYLDGFDIDDNEKEDEEDDDDGDESDLLNSEDGEEDYDEYEGEGEYDDSDGQFGEEGEAFGEDEIEEEL